MTGHAVNAVLEDLEETFDDPGILPLYQVGWTMSGHVPRTDPSFDAQCRVAFDAFRSRHPELVLASMGWPLDLDRARLADPEVEIELDLDPEAPADVVLLVLMSPSQRSELMNPTFTPHAPATPTPDPGGSTVERPDGPIGRGLHRRPHQDPIARREHD